MSVLNLNLNENELVMESMVSQEVETKAKKVSKSLTMNEKRVMYGILSFLVIVNRDGLLDDAKTQELMEHLPIFNTIAEKKSYLSQEMFDMKQIETDILKPMILEHNQKKKQEKKKGKGSVKTDGVKEVKEKKKRVNKKKEGEEVKVKEGEEVEVKAEVKEKKKRVNKKKEGEEVKVKEGEEVEVKAEVKEKKKRVNKKKEGEEVKVEAEVKEKKRGRKTKEQIVECKMDVNVNEGNSQEDQLAELVNQLTDPRDIDVNDLETILSNLEEEAAEKEKEKEKEEEGEGEGEEEKRLPETPRLPDPVPVLVPKEKVQKKRAPKKNKD
jgi:hypothetical protein